MAKEEKASEPRVREGDRVEPPDDHPDVRTYPMRAGAREPTRKDIAAAEEEEKED